MTRANPMLGKHHTEEARMKMSIARKARVIKQETREKLSKTNKEQGRFVGDNNPMRKPELVAKIAAKKRGVPHTQETKDKIAASLRGRKHLSEEAKAKLSELRKGENNPQWKGGVSYEPYCPKFNNEFKERVRAFFGHKCVECGAPQNGKLLAVHHVNFNKKACCDNSIPLFVPLCASCHSKTNTHRDHWQEHFTTLINEKYGGQCYILKDGVLIPYEGEA